MGVESGDLFISKTRSCHPVNILKETCSLLTFTANHSGDLIVEGVVCILHYLLCLLGLSRDIRSFVRALHLLATSVTEATLRLTLIVKLLRFLLLLDLKCGLLFKFGHFHLMCFPS